MQETAKSRCLLFKICDGGLLTLQAGMCLNPVFQYSQCVTNLENLCVWHFKL